MYFISLYEQKVTNSDGCPFCFLFLKGRVFWLISIPLINRGTEKKCDPCFEEKIFDYLTIISTTTNPYLVIYIFKFNLFLPFQMAHRLLVNVIFTGASVFGRAFTEAYRQAAKASAAGAAGRPAKASSAGGIPVEEAMKILDLEKSELSLDKVEEKYEYLFNVNSKEQGIHSISRVKYIMRWIR